MPRNPTDLTQAGVIIDLTRWERQTSRTRPRTGMLSRSTPVVSVRFWYTRHPFCSQQRHKASRDSGNNTKTSSYFDLSPLYGNLPFEEHEVRNRKLGRKLLHPGCFKFKFADDYMLFFKLPPGATTLLVVFNRHHNMRACSSS